MKPRPRKKNSTGPFNFEFDTPFLLEVDMNPSAFVGTGLRGDVPAGSATATVTDLELEWLGYTIRDGVGDIVSGASISGDSSTNYGTASIPEPSSFALLGITLLGGAAIAARRKNTRRKSV